MLAAEEESEPALPVTSEAHRGQSVVVLGTVELQVVAEAQQRTAQHPRVTEQECDQQAPDPAVAIREWMDGLELGMGESASNQRVRRGAGIVQEELEITQGGHHLVGRWRDERGISQELPVATADPVLRPSGTPRGTCPRHGLR